MLRARDREQHALGDVLRRQRLDSFVDALRLLLVAAEADERELRLDEPWVDGRHVNGPAEQILAEGVREATDSELGGDVAGRVLVRLPSGNRADVDDVAAVVDVRQAERVMRIRPRTFVSTIVTSSSSMDFPDRLAPEREAGVVDEDVKPAELGVARSTNRSELA